MEEEVNGGREVEGEEEEGGGGRDEVVSTFDVGWVFEYATNGDKSLNRVSS